MYSQHFLVNNVNKEMTGNSSINKSFPAVTIGGCAKCRIFLMRNYSTCLWKGLNYWEPENHIIMQFDFFRNSFTFAPDVFVFYS